MAVGTWATDVWAGIRGGRPLEAYVSVVNPTEAPMDIVVRLAFAPTGSRTQRATIAPGETWGAKVRSLFGSQASQPAVTLAGLTVTCSAGKVACPVSFSWLAAPTCTPP